MKRYIALTLSTALCTLMLPQQAHAHEHAVDDGSCSSTPAAATLVYSDRQELSNGWIQTYSIYADPDTGDVWGDGYAEDPDSIDARGVAGRWLSYSHYNGEFDFLGSDDGERLRASIGPEDVTWTWSPESGWIADITYPGSGPQGLWGVLIVVAAAAILLSGDSGCSCGHSGGTENHPGTNHPE